MIRRGGALLLVVGCAGRGEHSDCGSASGLTLTTTTDYTVGALATLDPASGDLDDRVASVGGDPVLRWADGLYQLNRVNADTIRAYQPGALCRAEWETALDHGANAHDVARVGDELWVAQYDLPELAVLGVDGEARGSIDVAELADADGIPEVHDLLVVGDRVFASAQRFDRADSWAERPGIVAELDRGGAIVASWEVGPSPRIYADPASDGLLVLSGTYGKPDGALSHLDPDSGAFDPWLTEDEVGLDFEGLAAVGERIVIGAATFELGERDATDTAALVCLDVGGSGEVITRGPGWYVDLASDGSEVWIGVRSGWSEDTRPGLVQVDPERCELVGERVEPALEPYSLLFVGTE